MRGSLAKINGSLTEPTPSSCKRNDLSMATATDLARGLRKARKYDEEPEAVLIDLAPDDEYSPKESVVDPISFTLLDDGRTKQSDVTSWATITLTTRSRFHAALASLLKPLLQRLKAQLVAVRQTPIDPQLPTSIGP